ncbi:MAG: alkylphosphonate utilization protein [Corynebacterium sp.]|uniref:alkylphosphonate utilization protein n=1 Tax=Corynebacterium sp. TaxID=1720 RepID=UPI0027097D10|nr:alkylphosphonate utilization protein [Corynebacterium sp.]
MSDHIPPCPECDSEYTYEDGSSVVCPMCGHEWIPGADDGASAAEEAVPAFRDAVGNELVDGDTVTINENLPVKGGSPIKRGTKVTKIKLLDDPVNGHDISATVPGAGQMYLKTSVVKKV